MKKIILLLCALLFAAGAFSESVYDYIPRLNGRFECSNGFTVDIGGNGISYSIANQTAETDILAVRGSPAQIEFIVRTRGRNCTGTASLYRITVNSDATITAVLCSTSPFTKKHYWCFTAELNDSSVNVRDTPGVSGNRLAQYQKGDSVTFTGAVSNNISIDNATDYWYSIDQDGGTGWIYGKYITFPTRVFLNIKMFKDVQDAQSITELPVKARYVDSGTKATDVFTAGTSNVYITNDGYGEFSESSFSCEGNGFSTELVIPKFKYYQFEPETGTLIYLTEYDGNNNYTINCLDCKTGKSIDLTKETGSGRELLVSGPVFAINNTGTKLVYLDTPQMNDGWLISYQLCLVDLTSYTLQEYKFNRALKPSEICWINDDTLLVAENCYDYPTSRCSCHLVSLFKGNVIFYDTVTFSYSDLYELEEIEDTGAFSYSDMVEFGKTENPYTITFIPTDNPEKVLLCLGDGDSYRSTVLLTMNWSSIIYNLDSPLGYGNYFSNEFWYQGERYLAFYSKSNSTPVVKITIYDGSLTEIRADELDIDSITDYVNWVGIQDDELIVVMQEN